ncbi:IclR family transcriptional regulator [Amylibacter sp. IMCC11727]|uniref:IclR family transcriptional regulator n=1 Tax=Amylibacter sp. IMCC11727 TaxID=3039851 RepID=UPI00244E2E8A|nr:IclR family transcriptional regulator [Amylibacter sp. IMCC11727]WGI22287.1 IclR family transcriptional regulator [Amylibacter sp. IMCC11727]
MSTVDKALGVLELFSETRTSVGLSEAARLLERDKATVQRYLAALESQGFLEQDPLTRGYHLGPAVTRLAMVRELTYPVESAVKNVLKQLVQDTGETAHLTHIQDGGLSEVQIVETTVKGTRVYIDPAALLPLHATASGIAFLSQVDPKQIASMLGRSFERFTQDTPANRESVLAAAKAARDAGFARAVGTFETDVVGTAAPVFNMNNEVCGSIAVAAPTSRYDAPVGQQIAEYVMEAAKVISRIYGARDARAQHAAE